MLNHISQFHESIIIRFCQFCRRIYNKLVMLASPDILAEELQLRKVHNHISWFHESILPSNLPISFTKIMFPLYSGDISSYIRTHSSIALGIYVCKMDLTFSESIEYVVSKNSQYSCLACLCRETVRRRNSYCFFMKFSWQSC